MSSFSTWPSVKTPWWLCWCLPQLCSDFPIWPHCPAKFAKFLHGYLGFDLDFFSFVNQFRGLVFKSSWWPWAIMYLGHLGCLFFFPLQQCLLSPFRFIGHSVCSLLMFLSSPLEQWDQWLMLLSCFTYYLSGSALHVFTLENTSESKRWLKLFLGPLSSTHFSLVVHLQQLYTKHGHSHTHYLEDAVCKQGYLNILGHRLLLKPL